MARQRYSIDNERAERVVNTLIDAWNKRLPPYDHAEPVPGRLPKTLVPGSKEHALFLFVGLLYMRGRIDSAQAFLRLCDIYDAHPWMFEPKNFAERSVVHAERRAKMQWVLREHGLGFNVRETVRFWDFNLRKLARFWDGNVLNVVESASDYDELCKLFMVGKGDPDSRTGFMGLREKMVSLFLYFLINAKLIEPMRHPGPVDTHNIRVLASTEVIVSSDGVGPGTRYEFYEVSPVIREVYLAYCKTVDDILALANALWYLSRDFCSASQGNGSHSGKYRARATETWAKRVTWPDDRVERYGATCGLCPLEEMCKWSLPSARQYNQGFLEIRSKRPKPHIHQVKLVHVPKTISSRGPKPPKKSAPLKEESHPSLFDDPQA